MRKIADEFLEAWIDTIPSAYGRTLQVKITRDQYVTPLFRNVKKIEFSEDNPAFLIVSVMYEVFENYLEQLPPKFDLLLPEIHQKYVIGVEVIGDSVVSFSNIGHFKNIEYLCFESNSLDNLPENIAKLQRLRFLVVKDNWIDTLPETIFSLSLEKLNLDGNKFSYIPDGIKKFSKLTYLSIVSNGIESIPNWLSSMIHLQHLYLASNRISLIPDEILNLSLQYLSLEMNYDMSIRKSTLHQLWKALYGNYPITSNNYDDKDRQYFEIFSSDTDFDSNEIIRIEDLEKNYDWQVYM